MALRHTGFLLLIMLLLTGCVSGNKTDNNHSDIPASQQPDSDDNYVLKSDVRNINEHIDFNENDLNKVYFAGGCFWGVEAFFKKVYGVSDVVSGYANGTGEDPSYQDVMEGADDFVEAVEITFDPNRIDLKTLVDDLFLVIDPTSKNKQGNDVGVQYRTGVYTKSRADLDVLQQSVDEQQSYYDNKIVTEVEPLENFYLAEEVHQDYLEKNPNGYCHVDLGIVDELAVRPIEEDVKIIRKYSVSEH